MIEETAPRSLCQFRVQIGLPIATEEWADELLGNYGFEIERGVMLRASRLSSGNVDAVAHARIALGDVEAALREGHIDADVLEVKAWRV